MRNDDIEVRMDRQGEGMMPLTDVRNDRHQDAPLGTLLKQLTSDTAELLRQELELAKAEIRETGTRVAKDATKVGVAAGLAFMGGLSLTAFLVIALGRLLNGNYWLSALIVGVVAFGVGYTMVKSAIRDLSQHGIAPKQTLETLKEDQRWASREMRDLKRDLTDDTVNSHARS